MKYIFPLLLLLFTSCSQIKPATSYSQTKPADLTSVEIFRCYGKGMSVTNCELTPRPINLKFLSTDYLVRYFSKNDKTVRNLYEIYSNGKYWKKKERDKLWTYYGDGNIQNMIIITYNSFRDTIYTTKDNKSFFYKNGDFEYIDKEAHIVNAFDVSVKNFFEKNFEFEFDEKLKKMKNDSIDEKNLKLNSKKIYGLTKSEFEKEIDSINEIDSNSIKFEGQDWMVHTVHYFNFHDPIVFDNDNNTLSYFSIKSEGIKINIEDKTIEIGDSYEKIKQYFKASATKTNFEEELYNREDKTNKTLEINYISNKGRLFLNFKNEKLEEIDISYKSYD